MPAFWAGARHTYARIFTDKSHIATLTIRNIDAAVKGRFSVRAAQHPPSGRASAQMSRERGRRRHLVVVLAAAAMVISVAAAAAVLNGVSFPDTVTLDGTELRLNGIALRTYSWMRIHIYVAALYLEHPTHEAEAILDAREKKLLVLRFVHDVSANQSRTSWLQGFEANCRPPCYLASADVQRFLAAVPAMRAGDRSTFAFTPAGLSITVNGRTVGTIRDRMFARAILSTFIGANPPTARLKRELLGRAE